MHRLIEPLEAIKRDNTEEYFRLKALLKTTELTTLQRSRAQKQLDDLIQFQSDLDKLITPFNLNTNLI
jgi:hypothetical protein